MEMGIPYLRIISSNKAWVTSWAFSVRVGKASTHPENVLTIIRRYLVASGSRHFSEVYFQVFKRGTTYMLDSWFRAEPLFVASYKGLVSNKKLDIQIW
jgi:hypothetical protein